MNDDRKVTMADIEAIIDAARYHADLMNQLEQAYQRGDLNQTLIAVRELLGIKNELIH